MNTNRKKIILFLALVCLILFISFKNTYGRRHPASGDPMSRRVRSDDGSGAQQNGNKPVPKADFITKLSTVIGSMNAPIEFFGKVVDENGAPVPNAEIKFMVNTAGDMAGAQIGPAGTTNTLLSDATGLFHIKGFRGVTLSIRSVGRKDYRSTEGGAGRSFSFGDSPSPHRPDRTRPVEFLVISKGTKRVELVGSFELNLHWNETSYEIPFGPDGDVLVVTPSRDRKTGEASGYAWNVKVELKQGTILQMPHGQGVNLAPADGYASTANFGFSRDAGDWSESIDRSIVVFKTLKGKYGKAEFSLYGDRDNTQSAGFSYIRLNLDGGRNLE